MSLVPGRTTRPCGQGKEVLCELERRASAFISFTQERGLILNPEKTQIMMLGARTKSRPLLIGDALVEPQKEMEILGTVFTSTLDFTAHNRKADGNLRSRSGSVVRLQHHLPTTGNTDFLRSIAHGIWTGKLMPNLSVTSRVRFHNDDPNEHLMHKLQVSQNQVARALTRSSRYSHVPTDELLNAAEMLSVNQLAARTVLLDCWKALQDPEHPLFMYLNDVITGRTRSAGTYRVPPPSKTSYFVRNALRAINLCPQILQIPLQEVERAKKLADSFAKTCPVKCIS
jgi:hypothetical protein